MKLKQAPEVKFGLNRGIPWQLSSLDLALSLLGVNPWSGKSRKLCDAQREKKKFGLNEL